MLCAPFQSPPMPCSTSISRGAAILAAVLATSSVARADTAAAEVLFEEGRRLLAAKDYAAACPKLRESHRIDPGIGVLLYLGDCHAGAGQTASAWSVYREAEAAARKAGQPDREKIAHDKAAALEPQLSRIVLSVADGVDATGISVRLGEQTLGAATMGVALPVDPGRYGLEVTMQDGRRFTQPIEVAAGQPEQRIVLTPPEDAGAPSAASAAPPSTSDDPVEGGGWSSQKTAAVASLGVGAVGIGIGAVFGLLASGSWSDADALCGPGDPRQCTQEGAELGEDASTQALVSTIGFGVGLAGIGAGVVLWLTAPGDEAATAVRVSPRIGPTTAGVQLGGVMP
jgi:hypothetical protein